MGGISKSRSLRSNFSKILFTLSWGHNTLAIFLKLAHNVVANRCILTRSKSSAIIVGMPYFFIKVDLAKAKFSQTDSRGI